MSTVNKALAGVEDLNFDTDGLQQTFGRRNSTGSFSTIAKINASHVPLLSNTRKAEVYNGELLGANDVDQAVINICSSLESIHVFSNQNVLDQITSAGSGSIITGTERTKLTSITDIGSGKIITATERNKLNSLDNISQDDLDAIAGVSNASPVGSVILYPTEVMPTGFLACEGQSLDRDTYSDLFAIIGVRFGSNSATTFKLPDMRGQFARGWDNGRGLDPDASIRNDRGDGTGGDVVGSLEDDVFAQHTHATPLNREAGRDGDFYGQGVAYAPAQGDPANINTNDSSTGGSETRPTNMNWVYAMRVLSI